MEAAITKCVAVRLGVTRWRLRSRDGGCGHEMCGVEVSGHEVEAAVTGYVVMRQGSRDVRQ